MGWYKTNDRIITYYLYNTHLLDINDPKFRNDIDEIIEIFVPKGITKLYCHNNNIEILHLPNGLKELCCFNNKLKQLNLPKGLTYAALYNNNIKTVTIPSSLKYLICDINVKLKKQSEINCFFNKNIEISFLH